MDLNHEPIRVLHVFNWFNQGGIENFVINVYRNIDRRKIQFDFAFPTNRKGYFDDEVLALGGRIFFFDSEKKSLWNYYKNLRLIIKSNGPYAAIHSHIYYFSGYILLIAWLCGIKIRLSHSHETQKGRRQTFLRKLYQSFMRWLILRTSTHRLACSDAAGVSLFGSLGKFQTVYNGIDFNRFHFDAQLRSDYRLKLGLKESDKVLINVGRFADQKNHKFIIELFHKLVNKQDNYRLILIGTGSLKENVISVSEKLGIIDKIYFLENIQNAEAYYCAADLFILPSLYEGLSIVSTEAQATGLPSLLSDKITREVGVTELSKYLPIDNSDIWVIEVEETLKKHINRTLYVDVLKQTSFNVHKTIEDLIAIYKGQR